VLSIGFEPFNADDPAFRSRLARRCAQLEELAVAGVPSPVNPHPVPQDRAAQAVLASYQRAVARYTGHCFRVRVALASGCPLPSTLMESLAGTVSSAPGAVRPVRVAAAEVQQAVSEFRVLGAPPWLPQTFAQSLNSQAEFARVLERNMPGLGDDDLIVLPEPMRADEVTDAIVLGRNRAHAGTGPAVVRR
jgi:hypothetical protein